MHRMLIATVGADSNLVSLKDIESADVQTLQRIQIVIGIISIVVAPNSTPSMFQHKHPHKCLISVRISTVQSSISELAILSLSRFTGQFPSFDVL